MTERTKLSKTMEEKLSKIPNPYDEANFIDKLTYGYCNSLIYKGLSKPLQEQDLWNLRKADSSEVCYERLEKSWNSLANVKKG
jgi:hypothetical protein